MSSATAAVEQEYAKGAEAYHRKDYAAAAGHFRKAVELDADYFRAWAFLGMANASAGRIDEAIENYRKCIDINGSYHKAFNNIGELYRRKGQLDYAVMVFKMATEMDGAEPHYFYNLGLAYGDVGMLQQSEGSLRKAHEMAPAEFDFASELSQVQFSLQRYDDSIRTMNAFLSVAPGHERRAEAEAKLKMLERRKAEKNEKKAI